MTKTLMNLDKNTTITVAAAATAIGLAVSATWWVAHQLNGIRGDLQSLKATMTSAASEQALRMAIENPGFRVPDPRDLTKVIVVGEKRQ